MTYEVVIIDDTEELRALIQIILERSAEFHVVGQAENGERGIEVVAACRPDLVLLDVAMPVLDGLQALPGIRQASPSSCVVMLSAYAHFVADASARRAGAFTYVEKADLVSGLVPRLVNILGEFRGEAIAS